MKCRLFFKVLTILSATIFFNIANAIALQKTVYVSASQGNDSHDGSINAPLKTFANIPRKDAVIMLKRGDVFYGSLKGLLNCTVDAYGEGAKPLICGFKHLKNPQAWENLGDDVWRLDLNNNANFDGNLAPNPRDPYIFNDIGVIMDRKTNTLHGHMVRKMKDLKKDWDFFLTEKFERKDLSADTFKYIYVKMSKKPSDGTDLYFSPHSVGMEGLNNCVIKNIAIQGFGRHGITGVNNSRIENVDIDSIGGSIQVGYKNWVRLGNGIEFWIADNLPQQNNIVTKCTISRTYDCGCTIQGIGKKLPSPTNIKYVNNNFYRCRQAFEHFLTSKEQPADYIDCEFSNNVAIKMGDNEFSTPEPRDMNLLSYERSNKSIKISNNTFYGAGVYFGIAWSTNISDNTCYVFDDGYLASSYQPQKVAPIKAADTEAYRKRFNDYTSKIILVQRGETEVLNKLMFPVPLCKKP